MEMTQYFQQIVLEQVGTSINCFLFSVIYVLTF